MEVTNLYGLDLNQIRIFLLLMVRISVIIFFLPVFGSRNWPVLAKVGFVLTLALVLFPAARNLDWPPVGNLFDFGLVVLTEALIGLSLGLTIDLILAGIQLGGQILGFQLGFTIANVIDPQSGTQVSITGQMIYLMVILLFLVLNGHHVFILALSESLTLLRPGQVVIGTQLFNQLMTLCLQMFTLSIKIVAPALAVLLFAKTAMGIIAKAVPQINVMIVSFPLNIAIGLFFLGISFAWIGEFMTAYVSRDLAQELWRAMRGLGGG